MRGDEMYFVRKSKVRDVLRKHIGIMELVKGDNKASINAAVDALQEILDLT